VSQQQRVDNVSIDDFPVDINNTQSGKVDSGDVPDEIESITRGFFQNDGWCFRLVPIGTSAIAVSEIRRPFTD